MIDEPNTDGWKKTTVYLPSELHKELKVEATRSDRTLNDILVEQLAARYPDRLFFGAASETKDHEESENFVPQAA
jgi:hypothetical protein